MIVYNTNPKGTSPIVIVSKWREDPKGGPAIQERIHMIRPGDGIELSIIGLEPSSPADLSRQPGEGEPGKKK